MRPGTQTAFRDVTLSFALVMAVVFLLPHLPKQAERERDTRNPGAVTGQITWPDGMAVDVDLWFRGPDGVAVGYNNLGGPIANLLRDDLGSVWDFLRINHEIIATRGAPPGEYQFNIYYFRGDIAPVPVRFEVRKQTGNEPATVLYQRTVDLKFMTQEITMVRFSLDTGGWVVPNSLNQVHRPIATIGVGSGAPGHGTP